MTSELRGFLQSKQCDYKGNTVYVCCDDEIPPPTIYQKPITTTRSTTTTKTTIKTTTTPSPPEITITKDITCKSGHCVMLSLCPHLFNLANRFLKNNNEALKNKDRDFLRSKQCGYHNESVYVCCEGLDLTETTPAPTTTTPEPGYNTPWLVKLRNLLPRPPVCGISASNKIFGGVNTEIDDHPWMALLKYLVEYKDKKTKEKFKMKEFHCGGSLINKNYVLTGESGIEFFENYSN